MSSLSAPHFHDEEAAYGWVEARLWPDGPVCPRFKGTERITALKGESTRIGVRFCNPCRTSVQRHQLALLLARRFAHRRLKRDHRLTAAKLLRQV